MQNCSIREEKCFKSKKSKTENLNNHYFAEKKTIINQPFKLSKASTTSSWLCAVMKMSREDMFKFA